MTIVNMEVQDISERSRLKILSALIRFITVDNHEALKVGDLEKYMESKTGGQTEVHGRFF